MERRAILALLFLAGAALGSCSSAPSTLTLPIGHGHVVAVADGDTITVHIHGQDVIVRLIGVDTPEVGHHDTQVECYGPQASQATKDMLPVGTTVRLTRGPEARDIYNRLLAYVWRVSDNQLINLELLRQGYAETLDIAPNSTHALAFRDAARSARTSGLGLWSACPEP